MAWQNNPKIRHLGDFSKKFNQPVVVAFSLQSDGQKYWITTYGANAKLCKLAKGFGDEINRCIQNGTIQPPAIEPEGFDEPTLTEWDRNHE